MTPQLIAYTTIFEMMEEGLAKGHLPDGWKDEPQDNHLDKAVRHIMTHKLQRDGNAPKDHELHLRNALCRLAFALAQELEHGEKL